MLKGLVLVGVMGIAAASLVIGPALAAGTEVQVAEIEVSVARDILDVTVSIQMLARNPSNPSRLLMARGMGTLVSHAGRNLMITHDHWGEMLEWATMVRFLDAGNGLLLELGGEAFRSLIHHRDGGTTVLAVPGGLIPDELSARSEQTHTTVTTAELGDGRKVGPGDQVLVTYHDPQHENQVAILAATVESVEGGAGGSPVLILRSVNGEGVVPGDSGGGVWVDGQLVGNLWSRVLVQDTSGQTIEAPNLFMAATHPLAVEL